MTYGVVTVTLNAAATLQRTIDSVIGQANRPSSYVFVDGGSRDGTLAIIERAAAEMADPAIGIAATVVRQTSKGITSAWNLGIRRLSSDLVFILNADDWYEPDAASRVLQEFESHPETEVLLASGRYIDPAGTRHDKICKPRPAWVLPVAMTAIHPACFVRRDLYDRIGLFDERYAIAADYEFVYRCVKHKVPIRLSDRVVVNVLEGGTASQQRRLARKEMAEVGARYCAIPSVPAAALCVRSLLNR